MPGNLFPSCKLKGNHTFTAWAATVGNDLAEEDPGVEQEGEEETEPSADEEVEVLGKVKEADQSIKYIAHFIKVVELYQKKKKNSFMCGSPDHFVQDCPKDVSRPTQKVYLNKKEGMVKKGAGALRSWLPLSGHLWMRCLEHKDITEDSLLESRPTHSLEWGWNHSPSQDLWWELLGSLEQWFYDQCSYCRVFKAHSLDVVMLINLVNGALNMNGFGRLFSWPLGYVIKGFRLNVCRAKMKIKWPWSFQIQLTLDPMCKSFWAHWLSTES